MAPHGLFGLPIGGEPSGIPTLDFNRNTAKTIVSKIEFDIQIEEEKPEQSAAEPMSIQPVSPATVPVTRNQSKSRQKKQAVPRPTISQILLSETSIRIYLYLGAFFVIA